LRTFSCSFAWVCFAASSDSRWENTDETGASSECRVEREAKVDFDAKEEASEASLAPGMVVILAAGRFDAKNDAEDMPAEEVGRGTPLAPDAAEEVGAVLPPWRLACALRLIPSMLVGACALVDAVVAPRSLLLSSSLLVGS
jgi:hypothetical protein